MMASSASAKFKTAVDGIKKRKLLIINGNLLDFILERCPEKAWKPPSLKCPKNLTLYNSLTKKKELFVPIDSKQVKWYICGPTVYDSAHMGHARAYLSFDILRRVLQNYFGYDIQARQHHLLKNYLAGKYGELSVTQIIEDVILALNFLRKKCMNETDPDKKKLMADVGEYVNIAVKKLKDSLEKSEKNEIDKSKDELLYAAEDMLSDWLDAVYGSTVDDLTVFERLAKKYESEFLSDMAQLNVLPPTILTRVSEYIPEIIKYVQKIVENGFGYVVEDGSVYFDTIKFDNSDKHFYCKLVPEAFTDRQELMKSMQESEGELSMGNFQCFQNKRNVTDFVLWKASKQGEPYWHSPWGNGRPGWHIECSAMSSKICGPSLDIHAGGFDLKFPHHDNEMAQVEAYYGIDNWVNYFLHCGTLRIAGLKMSKSLKNFITIRDVLKQYTARQLRILFLMHNWNDVLDYSSSSMERALQFEKVIGEFFLLIKSYLRKYYKPNCSESYQKMNDRELQLLFEFSKIKNEINLALCDSVDTRTVIEKLRQLVYVGNAYITEVEKLKIGIPNCLLLRDIASYMTWLFKIFGVIPENIEIGFPNHHEMLKNDVLDKSKEELLMPYLTALVEFRENVRKVAREKNVIQILKECDRLRDEILPDLGVRLEDRTSETCIKIVGKETLMREQQQKEAIGAAKEKEKQRKKYEAERKEAIKRIPPWELFKRGEEAKKYSEYDEKGIPISFANGEEISKKLRKKLEKLYEIQQKNYSEVIFVLA
ncbi:unnamed protein product [Thelazia callipaeda]|uniref:Cysteine--tRNA ligase, cytoplasmic n=1 Tax=Thelazia callipaeda TaxID=103827 RepID=A0A0N5D2F4_THECL|nr:unnamed protein product [Thelazia callipaeda]